MMDASDRCDRCGAQAYVITKHGLMFCAHHANNLPPSEPILVDERSKLLADQKG